MRTTSIMMPALGLALLAGCQVERGTNAETQGSDPAANAVQAPVTPPSSASGGAAAGQSAPAATTTAAPTEARTITANVQGTAPVGATVRVKTVELGTDATLLNVSASYGGTTTRDINLAGSPTYLLDEQGNKFMLKPPQNNPDLRIAKGEMMDGQLVFLGAVPPGTKMLKLVFNDGNDGDSIIDPGLTIQIPLDGK